MIDFVEGYIAKIGANFVVIDVSGVGFYVKVSSLTTSNIGCEGESVRLLTRLIHKEDSMELYGFASESERSLYDALLSVGGIGPKMAMTILSGMAVDELVSAIVRKDYKTLASIKGLGKKRAEKLCFELEEKLAKIEIASGAEKSPVRDAADALIALGYSPLDANRGVREAREIIGEANADALIRMALEILRK